MNNLLEQDITTMDPTFIFVDGSYYNFYRYFALQQWWKNAYPDEPLDDPYQNEIFVEKFNYTFDTTEFTFSDDDMSAFLFLMLHGLYVARNEYGFFHNDIKLKNLMLSIVGSVPQLTNFPIPFILASGSRTSKTLSEITT